ncbi:hypothetical protein YQE_00855, partial [Dendroctonus ponderosae]
MKLPQIGWAAPQLLAVLTAADRGTHHPRAVARRRAPKLGRAELVPLLAAPPSQAVTSRPSLKLDVHTRFVQWSAGQFSGRDTLVQCSCAGSAVPNNMILEKGQLLSVLASTIGAISDGMHYGWSAPFMPILEKEDSHIKISHSDVTWLESIYLIGGLAGLPVTIYCVDRLGRKASILLAAVISLIAWILIALADDVIYLYVARFMVGLSGDVAFVAAPMYIAEIADKRIRGFLAGVIYVMMLVGILVVYAVAPFAPFYACSVIGSLFVIIQLVTFPFMPDSPYYLLQKTKSDKAKRHLMRLRTGENIDKELEEITAAVLRQRSERGRPQDLVLSKSNRKALIIMTVLNAAQHFSSISVMLMNLHSILKEAESEYVSFEIAGIMFSSFMLIAATIADFVVDKCGRKGLLISSSLLSGLALLDVGGISWIPVAAVMVYAAVFKFGLGIIPIVMTAELFPAKVKAMGMTLADFSYLFFGLISVELYQRLIAVYYLDLPFYIFASSTLLTAIFSWWYIPETKGKTLEEIQFILKGEPIPSKEADLESSEGVAEAKDKDIGLEELPPTKEPFAVAERSSSFPCRWSKSDVSALKSLTVRCRVGLRHRNDRIFWDLLPKGAQSAKLRTQHSGLGRFAWFSSPVRCLPSTRSDRKVQILSSLCLQTYRQ